MDSLKFNKIFAGMLCAGLLIMIFSKLGDFLVSPVEIVQNAYPIKVENKDSIKKDVREDIVEPILAMLASANIEDGIKIAKKCTACHVFEADGPNKVGPNLYNLINKEIGKSDYNYSKAFLALNGLWTYSELNKFLYKPKNYVKGTKMNFVGLKKTKDRANLIAWIRTLSENPVSLPTPEQINNSN